MAVGLEDHPRAGVAQPLGDLLRRQAVHQQDAGVAVAQVVEADRLDAQAHRPGQHPLPQAQAVVAVDPLASAVLGPHLLRHEQVALGLAAGGEGLPEFDRDGDIAGLP